MKKEKNNNMSISDLPPEVIYQILLVSEYNDILSYSRANKLTYDICQDMRFWIGKLNYELEYRNSEGLILKPSNYMKHSEKHRGIDIYRRWKKQDLDTNIRRKYNDIGFWMMDRYNKYWTPKLYQRVVNLAASYGNEELVLWFESIGLVPDQNGISFAIRDGQLSMLKLLCEKGIRPIQHPYGYDDYNIEYTAENGRLDILMWLHDLGLSLDIYASARAAKGGHLNILMWLDKKGIFIYQNSADVAAQNGHLNILRWLEKKGFLPNENLNGAVHALSKGYIDIVQWLEERGIIANAYIYPENLDEQSVLVGLNMAEQPILVGLNMTEQRKFALIKYISYNAAKDGYTNVLIWLTQRNIPLTQYDIDSAAMNGHIHTVLWIAQKSGLTPSDRAAQAAAENGNITALRWLNTQYGLLPPDRISINKIASHGNLDLLKYLHQKGLIQGNQIHISDIKRINFDLFEWSEQKGITILE